MQTDLALFCPVSAIVTYAPSAPRPCLFAGKPPLCFQRSNFWKNQLSPFWGGQRSPHGQEAGFWGWSKLKSRKKFQNLAADWLSFISSSVRNSYLRTERTPASAPANHRALRRRFYTLCMPKSEVQEALSSYFSSFVSRSAELEKSFLSWYRVCRLDSGFYILSVTKVSERMSCK